MKKALRIIVPLLLTLVLIAGSAWYFLVYDPAFTKELLLNQARKFEASGNYTISAFLYDVAYRQSSKDDAVAIELAQQYLDINNYTKAEYTLTQALSENPTAELYAALSDVFVQQDKLLDAVNLLNGVSDPSITMELDKMRPKAPVLTPEPGYYSQYINVEVKANANALYASTDADYPSTAKDAYAGPITLSTGETVIYAICVDENGLVSPLTVGGYTVKGVVEEVAFADITVEAAIREAVSATDKEAIFTDRLWSVTEFTVPATAKSYEDLQYLPHLTKLTFEAGSQGDLAVLEKLEQLQELELSNLRLSEADLGYIAAHPMLTHLSLAGCSLSTIQPLSQLTKLTYLDIRNNTVRNIDVLAGMTELQHLYLGNNVVNALTPLTGLSKLETLDISYNAVSTLAPLSGLTNLKTLTAGHNQIESTQELTGLTKLETLDLSHNNLTNISPVSGLTALIDLNCSNNSLTAMNGLERLIHLRMLNLSYNQITALPPFQKQCELVSIDMSHNLLLNVEALSGLPWLNSVNVDYNTDIEDLKPLDTCYVLVRVNAYGTKVKDVSFLMEKSIVVNFNPTLDK